MANSCILASLGHTLSVSHQRSFVKAPFYNIKINVLSQLMERLFTNNSILVNHSPEQLLQLMKLIGITLYHSTDSDGSFKCTSLWFYTQAQPIYNITALNIIT